MNLQDSDFDLVAQRGQLAVIVLTRAAARRKFSAWGLLHDDVAFVSVLLPDDSGEAVPVQHLSLDAVRTFLTEIQPHTLDVVGDRGEDASSLAACLRSARDSRPADITLN